MNIYINGEAFSLSSTLSNSLTDALDVFLTAEQKSMSFALALNGMFVSKTGYSSTLLKQGDSLDVLFPIVGG